MRIRRVLMVGTIVGATLGLGASPAAANEPCEAPEDSPAMKAICEIWNDVTIERPDVRQTVCYVAPDSPGC